MTLVSRILGLVRDVCMVAMLGFSWTMGTFAIAWMVPNLLRRLFGEGALAASFIPAYTRARVEEGPRGGRQLLASVSGLLLATLLCLTVLVWILCLTVPGTLVGKASEGVSAADQGGLLLRLSAILFPYALPICLTAVFAGALNTLGTFALPAAAPILLNLFWLGGLLVAVLLGEDDPVHIVTLVAAFLLAGGFGQMLLALIPLVVRGEAVRPRLPGAGDPAFGVLRTMGPTVIGMSLVQLNTVADQVLALYLVNSDAPAFLYTANRLLLFPHALTSLALATAVFPRLAAAGAKGDRPTLRAEIDRATRHSLLVALPAALGMMLVARPLVTVMFGSSAAVTGDDLDTATWTTVCLVAALPTIGIAQLHARAFYALGDYRTPAWMAFWLLLLNLVLNVALVAGLGLGVPGFAVATTLASLVQAAVLRLRLRARCPDGGERLHLFRPLGACAVMAGLVFATQRAFAPTSGWGIALLDLLLPVLVGMVSYFGVCYALGERRLRLR